MIDFGDLPPSWTVAPLSELTEYVQRGKSPKYTDISDLPVINQKCVRWGGLDTKHVKYIHSDQQRSTEAVRFLRVDDILWNSTGTGTIGRACLYRGEFPQAVVDSHVTIVRSDHRLLEPKYLHFFIMSSAVQDEIENIQSGSTNQVELSRKAILELPIPLPPPGEQRRIVEKIETLFAELDKGEESLRQVQTLLARYRQSVLKAAVTGVLTADWRARHAGKLEHGRDLLARILKARRENWQGRGKYKEPVEPDTADLPELPDGWVWATVDQVSMEVDYGSSAKCTELKGGVPVLRMGNIVEGTLTFDDLKYLPNDHREFPKLLLRLGDLLFNRTNSAELVGKTAVYKGFPERCSFASYLIRVRLCEVWPDYVSAYINSVFGRRWVASVVSQQVGQANVNGSKLKALAFPLPPLVEQEMIVRRMGEALERADDVSQRVHEELGRSSALRQSILKDAFSGKLVPQEPSDEPAAELLARIRAQRSVECKDAGRARVAI